MPNGSASRSGVRTALAGVLAFVALAAAGCAGTGAGGGPGPGPGTASPTRAADRGRVSVVYEESTVKPGDRRVVALIRDSRVLERTADWVNRTVALPHDLVVKVTAAVPPGVTDAVAQPDGRTIYLPPSFLTEVQEALTDVVKTVERPSLIPAADYDSDDLTVLATRFLLGHELGHALQRQLTLPNLGLEEDAADGFASFYTIGEAGPGPSLAAALLFDELARKEGELTLEGLASDHPVTQQRVFNFLCYLDGSDPGRFRGPLVETGYLPESRAWLCPQAWAMLDHGWWTQLQPHFTAAYRARGDAEQRKARERLAAETKAFAERIDEFRSGTRSGGTVG
ncbi:DUF4344 domain-containing metallopeptidase [Streptomyces sp. NPDC012888]|uniref:DUF4344 domain-containing metallopeptidase n=1 Tax=Streptomyces sp. NPDC012888 TaxID=3364855 RepID=UPI0036AAB0A8